MSEEPREPDDFDFDDVDFDALEPDDTPRDPPQSWIDALDEADADIAAGRTVSWVDVRKLLMDTLMEMEAEAAVEAGRQA